MAITEIGGFAIPWIDTVRPEDNTDMPPYRKQVQKSDVLPQGWKKSDDRRPLPCDIVYEQNVEVILRDGCKLFCDVMRPDSQEKVPAILCFSPYGKGGHGFLIFENSPFRLGIPLEATSGLEKFEAPDPAEWCPRGYAIVNVDVRGSWESEGDVYIEGTQPGVDAYDTIEYIAGQAWCNGACSMAGNSWLATTQWSAAIQAPPALKCIAPWEGFTDMYRNVLCRGGIPKRDFTSFIFNKTIRGRNRQEDLGKALTDWPLMNAFWADKRWETSVIDIPIYALASYCSGIHCSGTIEGWNNAKSKNKWLRIHPTQEWYDLYGKPATDDLQKFYDRYLKGIENDWEQTPRVRVSLLTYGDRSGNQPIENLPFKQYPPQETEYKTLYLTPSKTLALRKPDDSGKVSYKADNFHAAPAEFAHTFADRTVLAGFPKARLWMSCGDNDDMDIYLSIRKIDKHGKILEHINVPWDALPDGVNTSEDVPNSNTIKHLGPSGVLRASHRAQDPSRSLPYLPFHPHDKEEKVPPGEVVPVEIGIWPMGMIFEEGEGFILRVQGHLDQCVEFPKHIDAKLENLNQGSHAIHVGGDFDSNLTVPVLPIKLK